MYVTWLSTWNKHTLSCQPLLHVCLYMVSERVSFPRQNTRYPAKSWLEIERRIRGDCEKTWKQPQWRNSNLRRYRGPLKICIKNGAVSVDKQNTFLTVRCTRKKRAWRWATWSCGEAIKGRMYSKDSHSQNPKMRRNWRWYWRNSKNIARHEKKHIMAAFYLTKDVRETVRASTRLLQIWRF